MDRLFSATVSLIYEDDGVKARVSSLVADRAVFWWNPKRPDDPSLWDSNIRLGEDFFNEIIQHPVPLDMNILKALKRSSLGLDLYLWLTYRTFTLQCPLRLSWPQPLPPVRDGSGQSRRQPHRPGFSQGLPAGVDQDQDGLAEYALRDGQGRTDPLTLHPVHPAPSTRGIAATSRRTFPTAS